MTNIVQRYEKGQRFLDLVKWTARGVDDDGHFFSNECWECIVWENGRDANEHKIIEFSNEVVARMYITNNDWKEQVL